MAEIPPQDQKSPQPQTGAENDIDTLLRKAREHHASGSLSEAQHLYQQILETRPENAEVQSKLGAALAAQGKIVESESVLRRAIETEPDLAEAHINLGNVFQIQGKLEEAVTSLRRALEINPDQTAAHVNLGNILLKQGNPEDAAGSYSSALEIEPEFSQALNGLGTAFMQQNKGKEAAETFDQALNIAPDQPEILCNLGNLLRNQGKYDEAVETLRKAIAIQPNLIDAHINLGNTLKSRGEWDGAMDSYQQALSLDPENAETHWNNAQVLLLLGRLEEGWQEYEWRTKCDDFRSLIWKTGGPPWDGSNLDGKTILIYCEQGFGDSVQFIRYAQPLAALGATVIVKCPQKLQTLFQTVPGVDRAVTRMDKSAPYHLQASLHSLPRLLKTDMESIPAQVPYVFPPAASTIDLDSDGKQKVGIVWAGSPSHKNDQSRSMSLDYFKPLLDVEGLAFYSLQFGEPSQDINHFELGGAIVDLSGDLEGFTATAAVLAELDLIITVDTLTAHLAGALGKPVWTLLSFVPDWRWLLGRDDSPWYPSMRLFRQNSPGDWRGVMDNVEKELRQFLLN